MRALVPRAAALAVLVLLPCCGPGLVLTTASPGTLEAGRAATLTVDGEGFGDGLTMALATPAVTVSLGVTVDSDVRATAAVPASLPPGTYALVAQRGTATARLEGAVQALSGLLKIVFIDVGQGDATLIVAPTGETLLFDGGPPDALAAVRAALDRYAGGRLDVVVLSHVDADHLAGLVGLLAGPDNAPGTSDDVVPERRVGPTDDGSCDTLLCGRYRNLAAYPFTDAAPGDTIPLGDVFVKVVAADGDVGDGREPEVDEDNEKSVGLLFSFGDRTVLVAGDLTGGGLGTASLEAPLAAHTGPVDVLRVDHHGSATSSDPAALALWQPRAIVASMGTDNSYCHPAAEVVPRWAALGAPIYATGAGIVEDGARCDGPTAWPAQARPNLGDIVLEISAVGGITIAGDVL